MCLMPSVFVSLNWTCLTVRNALAHTKASPEAGQTSRLFDPVKTQIVE